MEFNIYSNEDIVRALKDGKVVEVYNDKNETYYYYALRENVLLVKSYCPNPIYDLRDINESYVRGMSESGLSSLENLLKEYESNIKKVIELSEDFEDLDEDSFY